MIDKECCPGSPFGGDGMTTFRTIGSIALILLALFFVVVNWASVIISERNKRKGIDRHHSTSPLLSIILAGAAFLLYPYTPRIWIWIIPVVDIGNWSVLIGLPWAIAKGAFKKKSPDK
jgi:hypothetical protein